MQGSPTLVQALYVAGLIDEWRLMTWPVILGSGSRLFPDSAEGQDQAAAGRLHDVRDGVQRRVPQRLTVGRPI